MSLKRCGIDEVPEMTVSVARAAFPEGNMYMQMRDELGTLFEDEEFAALYAQRGQPGLVPWRLALITVMQFAENLTDRQAADAVRGRIDWKYALGLELTDAGFDYSVLSEFRSRLLDGHAEPVLLDKMLTIYQARGLLKTQQTQRTDSTHVLAAIRTLNQLELAHETLHHALNVLAEVVPAWLKAQVSPVWFERYGERLTEFRLPKEKQEQQALAEVIGADGVHLLEQIYGDQAPDWLRQVPAVEILRQVWVQTFYQMEGQVRWREKGNQPPSSQRITSPYDLEARYSTKRDISWVGYKFHATETCTDDAPHLIIHVETRPGTEHDINTVDDIHQVLDEQHRLPTDHLVDASYISADELVRSETLYGVNLVGPVRTDLSWQARLPEGIDSSQFTIDWDQQRATCPQDHVSCSWIPQQRADGYATIKIKFRQSKCADCPLRSRCTRDQTKGRTLTVLPQPQFEALQAARQRQQTQEFKDQYATRAGVEGSISHAAFTLGLRRARYRGLAKTHLQHLATAAAINLIRVMHWLAEVPRSQTRQSRFAALVA